MLHNLTDLEFGIWVSHAEGKFETKLDMNSVNYPIRYIDDYGKITETYPFNPNGSPNGITSVCSNNGRHLAMMPHPERSFLEWQLPWYSSNINLNVYSPWFYMFRNAYQWCDNIL